MITVKLRTSMVKLVPDASRTHVPRKDIDKVRRKGKGSLSTSSPYLQILQQAQLQHAQLQHVCSTSGSRRSKNKAVDIVTIWTRTRS